MDCVTPSHPVKIPHGESVNIVELLQKGSEAFLDPKTRPRNKPAPEQFDFMPQTPVMESMNTNNTIPYLRAQMASDRGEFDSIVKSLKPSPSKQITTLKDKPVRTKRSPRKQQDNTPLKQSASSRLQRHNAAPPPMPIDWEDDNKFLRHWQERKGSNVDVGMMRRFHPRQTYARPSM